MRYYSTCKLYLFFLCVSNYLHWLSAYMLVPNRWSVEQLDSSCVFVWNMYRENSSHYLHAQNTVKSHKANWINLPTRAPRFIQKYSTSSEGIENHPPTIPTVLTHCLTHALYSSSFINVSYIIVRRRVKETT